MTETVLAILKYPGTLQSAVYGFEEIMLFCNSLAAERDLPHRFRPVVLTIDALPEAVSPPYQGVILPPALERSFYPAPDAATLAWIKQQHQRGSQICSACAGAFVLAATGLLDGRRATTHWGLVEPFRQQFPKVTVEEDKILINDGDIITAGGVMSWLDLTLELVAEHTSPALMRQLGKRLVVDTGQREQRYYKSFSPKLDHGDKTIRQVQHSLQSNYSKPLTVAKLAEAANLTERTFLRRFVKATGLKPTEYLQNLRIQKACDHLETTTDTVETVSLAVGYEDISAFRKIFVRVTGLTPREFRGRFGSG